MMRACRGLSVIPGRVSRGVGIPILLLLVLSVSAGCGSPETPPSKPAAPEKAAAPSIRRGRQGACSTRALGGQRSFRGRGPREGGRPTTPEGRRLLLQSVGPA